MWLERAQEMAGWSELAPEEQARAWMYLGLVREQAGDTSAGLSTGLAVARGAYEKAVKLAPALAEPRIRLLALLHRLGDRAAANRVAATLARRGPTYRLGTFGPGYEKPSPVSLPSGWTLMGYDLDEESLEAGGLMELWLWWQAPPGVQPTGEDWLPVGEYWLQRQEVVNLAPNPGFAWGMAANGLPLGYLVTYHTPTSEGMSIVQDVGPHGVQNPVLQIAYGGAVGIKTYLLPVNERGLHLTGAWLKRDRYAAVKMGRQCFVGDGSPEERTGIWGAPKAPKWELGKLEGDAPGGSWVHLAHLGPPLPGTSVVMCQLYFERGPGHPGDNVRVEHVLFARLSDGALPER